MIARHWRKYRAHTNATALVAHRTLPMPSKNGASDVAACWSSDASDSPSGTATRAPWAMALHATHEPAGQASSERSSKVGDCARARESARVSYAVHWERGAETRGSQVRAIERPTMMSNDASTDDGHHDDESESGSLISRTMRARPPRQTDRQTNRQTDPVQSERIGARAGGGGVRKRLTGSR